MSDDAGLITITIDGQPMRCRPGDLIIQVAQDNGVFIPRFCWHERMKPVGMCRMCLVEVEGVRGLPPACTTTATDGMAVHLQKENVEKVQDGVLEFLLVNHPLDCPVCDRGGECPLQDQTLAFGPGESRFVEEKRHFVKPIPISDHVLLDRERCIQCARCTRFADEIAGDPLITFIERGGETQVLNFPDEPFSSYFSGNTVQICPVGALTAKPYRFRARPWDLDTIETSCSGCSMQCRSALQSSSNRLVRQLGVDSEPVNHGWLCDKGRYGIEWVHSADRVRSPLVRRGAEFIDASWPEALDAAADGLRAAIDLHGPSGVAVIGGARLTNESAYSWARLAKGVWGTDNVDAQLGDGLLADAVLGLPRAEIADADTAAAVVLLAPDIKEELAVLYLRLRRAAVELGVPLIDLAARDNGLTPYASTVIRSAPGDGAAIAARLMAAVGGTDSGDPAIDAAAATIRARPGPVVVVLGRPSLAESATPTVAAAAVFARDERFVFLSALRRSNVHGALDLGLTPGFLPGRVTLADAGDWYEARWGRVPAERGLDTAGVLEAAVAGKIHALVLLGADPIADFPDRELATRALEAVPFVVAVDAFQGESNRRADVFLPVALWGEVRGTTTNLEGRVQRVGQKLSPEGTSLTDWRIAAELAQRAGVDFAFESPDEITDEIARVAPAYAGIDAPLLRRARDGAVVPLADHPGALAAEVKVALVDRSWDPIPPIPEEVVVEVEVAIDEDGNSVEVGAAVESNDIPTDLTPVASTPALYRWDASVTDPNVPARDGYALRLVSSRLLYDDGRLVQESPALAALAHFAELRVNVSDRERIGVADGTTVRVTTGRGSFDVAVRADSATVVGTAYLAYNRVFDGSDGPVRVNELIDARDVVTDLRVEVI